MSARVSWLVTLVSAALLIGVTGVSPATAGTRGGSADRHPVYVALGDSWASGLGASAPSEGYVPQLHAVLRRGLICRSRRPGCKRLELVNLGQAGATTPWLLESQLPTALALLERHNGDRKPRNDVKVVTLHIGGNDVVPPILAACPAAEVDAACAEAFTAAMTGYRRNLRTTLRSLRAAAGRRTRIVIGTYARVIVPPCPSPPVVDLIAEGDVRVGPGLYDVMRTVARRYHADVADVADSFGPGDLAGDCRHPNDSGYDKVTAAFLDVLLRAG